MKIKNSKILSLPIIWTIFIICIAFITSSCSKEQDNTNNEIEGIPTTVRFEFSDPTFDDEKDIVTKLASRNDKGNAVSSMTQKAIVPFNDDFYFVAELTPEKPQNTSKSQSGTAGTKVASVRSTIDRDIRIRALIFDEEGKLDHQFEHSYTKDQKSFSLAKTLTSGSKYTVIIYSFNSINSIPEISADVTLSTASIAIPDDHDFMYFKDVISVSSDGDKNTFPVVMKHQLSQITTTVDASATGYLISKLEKASFTNNYRSSTIKLSDGVIQKGPAASNTLPITFNEFGNSIVSSKIPTVINTGGVGALVEMRMGTVSIGKISRNEITTTAFTINPRVRYALKITAIPNDKYITYKDQRAVIINGKVWMRHNLGVDQSVDPDVGNKAIHGYFYQWGKKAHVATVDAIVGGTWPAYSRPSISIWGNGVNSSIDSGPRENILSKTSDDPCPAGYRVPVISDFTRLGSNTSLTITGASNDVTNFSGIVSFVSLTNKSVKVSFPMTGLRNLSSGGITERGSFASHWSSQSSQNSSAYSSSIRNGMFSEYNQGGIGRQIRCIAENSQNAIKEGIVNP